MRIVLHLGFIILFLLKSLLVSADEGMWLPLLLKQLNEKEMQAKGLKLSADDIYSVNRSSLKDAVIHFGGGCTGEIVSPEGLLFTNHHCGYSQIQQHSSVENDYLTNGFWAKNKEEELPNPGLTATFIIRMEDVTSRVLMGVTEDMDESKRQKTIEENSKKIEKSSIEGTHYEASIKSFYNGNEYYMFITETFKDVRLVGAPPSSIGKFGGDTDNWMWPRHTGDFSVFRVYAGKDNKPANYSKENVPFKPRHYFPISIKPRIEGDFTMVFGFPGRTTEYLSSYAVDYIMTKSNPAKIKMRETSLAIMAADMKKDDATRIKYSAKHARISNYYKKWQGENRGLKKLNAIETKKKSETVFNQKAKESYKNILPELQSLYAAIEPYALARDYFIEFIYTGPELPRFSSNFKKINELILDKKISGEELKKESEKLIKNSKGFYKDYNYYTDKKIFSALIGIYYNGVPSQHISSFLKSAHVKYNGDWEKYTDELYSKSLFSSEEKLTDILTNYSASSAKKMYKDPVYQLMENFNEYYQTAIKPVYDSLSYKIDKLNRIYTKAQKETFTDKKFYPDANSTLRLSYGKIEGYSPADAVNYIYYTTLSGIIEKSDPESDEFMIDKRLEELYNKKDYGIYGENDELIVCFTASNHTTGGNSGSPVLDGSGNLIGINFDRAWESTMSDIMYDPERCRNIIVDARYVLFVIDKFAGAGHLINEMQLVE